MHESFIDSFTILENKPLIHWHFFQSFKVLKKTNQTCTHVLNHICSGPGIFLPLSQQERRRKKYFIHVQDYRHATKGLKFIGAFLASGYIVISAFALFDIHLQESRHICVYVFWHLFKFMLSIKLHFMGVLQVWLNLRCFTTFSFKTRKSNQTRS